MQLKEDITIKSSILESRLIYGSKMLWFAYENVLSKVVRKNKSKKEFILEKLEEHKQRLLKYPLKNGTKYKRWLWRNERI